MFLTRYKALYEGLSWTIKNYDEVCHNELLLINQKNLRRDFKVHRNIFFVTVLGNSFLWIFPGKTFLNIVCIFPNTEDPSRMFLLMKNFKILRSGLQNLLY